MKLPDLSSVISQTHIALQSNAIKAINRRTVKLTSAV